MGLEEILVTESAGSTGSGLLDRHSSTPPSAGSRDVQDLEVSSSSASGTSAPSARTPCTPGTRAPPAAARRAARAGSGAGRARWSRARRARARAGRRPRSRRPPGSPARRPRGTPPPGEDHVAVRRDAVGGEGRAVGEQGVQVEHGESLAMQVRRDRPECRGQVSFLAQVVERIVEAGDQVELVEGGSSRTSAWTSLAAGALRAASASIAAEASHPVTSKPARRKGTKLFPVPHARSSSFLPASPYSSASASTCSRPRRRSRSRP